MKIKHEKDFYSGLMFTVIGVAFGWGATNYTIGSGGRMGAGYFPLVLSALMGVLGIAITFKALVVESEDGGKVGKWAWKQLVFVLGSNLAFGALLVGFPSVGIPSMGLIAAIFALVFIASLAGEKFHFMETLVVAIVLSIGSWVAFVWALKLQFPVWPSFITG